MTNYQELEDAYEALAKRKSYCAHINSKTIQDKNGIFHFHCSDCGLAGVGDYNAAIKFGWLL